MTLNKFIRKANSYLREARKYRKWVILGMAVLALAISYVLANGLIIGNNGIFPPSEMIGKMEGNSIDKRFLKRNENPLKAHPNTALVGINTSSLDQGQIASLIETAEKEEEDRKAAGKTQAVPYAEALKMMTAGIFPLPRKVYPYAIERLFELGAKVIAIDVLFVATREGDEDFAAVLKKHAGKVVLASSKNIQTDDEGNSTVQILRPNETLIGGLGEDGVGYAFFKPDSDGVVRRVDRMTSQMKESGFAHLAGADDWTRFSPAAVAKFTGEPVVQDHEFINYRGAAGTHMVFPIEELFVDRFIQNDPRYQGGQVFKDKIVFIGPISETFHDEHPTPLGTQPGVEIHQHYADSLLDKLYIHEFPQDKEMFLWAGMIVVAALLAIFVERVLLRVTCGVAAVGGYWFGAYYCFADLRIVIPIVLPLFSFISVGGFITLFDFAVEQLERAHVKGVLDKYVSSNVANLVVNQGDSFEQALRGVTKPVSVLFSDIRGFTTLSESRSPETLVSQLNEYFLQMVDKVLLEGGTLQKFIGDAIMAVWGDTHSLGLTQDCSHAMKAALKMRTALAELNAGWAGRDDRLELSIGVGINHGTVVVGELGHPQRMEFTVLGDGVNLAARLESATKQFGCDILVGETAYALTKDAFVFRRVDRAVFKGKTQPIHVFTPLGEAGMEVPGWLIRYHAALDLFYEQKFAEAKEKFGEVNTEMGGDDYLCLMYKKRCDHFLSEPPEADWDGRWVLSEK
jgi:adenylate cyclase